MKPVTEQSVGNGVSLYTLGRGGLKVVVTNWGATIMSLYTPDAQGYTHSSSSRCNAATCFS
jgi:hypothetical protein